MKIRLRVPSSAGAAIVPPRIHVRDITGEARPVPSFGRAYSAQRFTGPLYSEAPASNIGIYVIPPRPPIWVRVPTSIKPTKPCGGC